tara:strand:+ start:17 stop:568 length:552 start_codon:yes stop_codon:yes gene_type:complete
MHTFTRSKQMNRFHFITTLLLALSAFSPAWAADKLATLEIDNLNHPVENIYSSAQPAQASFKAIAESGIEVVVNLRPHSELDWDEQALVESLGMTYINLPVAGAADITNEKAKALETLLAELEGKQVLVHCSSSNRVGALSALSAYQKNGGDVNASVAEGKKWGLTRLEVLVREKLGEEKTLN